MDTILDQLMAVSLLLYFICQWSYLAQDSKGKVSGTVAVFMLISSAFLLVMFLIYTSV